MRSTLRLLAAVKPGCYLEPGDPTGLTGLFNHPAPRSTLLYLYGSTLDKLKAFPEHSVYKQSTEALTKHRMKIIESIKPEGYEEWAKRAAEKVQRNPEAFQPGNRHQFMQAGGGSYVTTVEKKPEDQEWTSSDTIKWEPEPALEASQLSDAEAQVGGGLIEEVIEVAEGELKLVNTMLESRVWEELEEKPQPGQWDYFARDSHTPGTQEPPNK